MIDGTGDLELLCDEDFPTDSTRGWLGWVVDRVVLAVVVVVAMLTVARSRFVRSYRMVYCRNTQLMLRFLNGLEGEETRAAAVLINIPLLVYMFTPWLL